MLWEERLKEQWDLLEIKLEDLIFSQHYKEHAFSKPDGFENEWIILRVVRNLPRLIQKMTDLLFKLFFFQSIPHLK